MYLPHVPDIRFCREDSVQEGFWRHPLDGQHGLAALAVVVRPVDVARHPEVGDLHHAVLALARQQTVPGVIVVINFLILLLSYERIAIAECSKYWDSNEKITFRCLYACFQYNY